ncbi:hypothetical protein ACP70R_047806 [Stipagrostis hirtigluma subsp. patula]
MERDGVCGDEMEEGDGDDDAQEFIDAWLAQLVSYAASMPAVPAARRRRRDREYVVITPEWSPADGFADVVVDDLSAYGGGGFGGFPASGEAVAALPETTVGDGGETGEAAQCAVCLEGYVAGDKVRTMPCSHGFHEGCILGWLAVSRLCPLCRFALPAEGTRGRTMAWRWRE